MESESFIRKIIVEARFRAKLEFFDTWHKLAKSFTKEFPDWLFDALRVSLYDSKEHNMVTIESKRIVFSFDRKGRVRDAKDLMLKVGNKIVESLEIDKFDRLGVRLFFAEPSPMKYEELNNMFILKTLAREQKFNEVFSGSIEDYALSLVLKKDDLNFRVQMGPTVSGETIQRISFEGRIFSHKDSEELQKSLSEANIFIDLDCWGLDIKTTNLSKTIEKFFSMSLKMVEDIQRFIKE